MRLDRLSLGCVLLLLARSSHGEFHPLPDWYFYGGANSGSWSGSSTSPSNAQLTVTMNFPMPPVPGPYATAVGQSSASVVQIESHTTYNFTFHAWLSAAAACEGLTLDDDGVIAHTLVSGLSSKRYTNSFTTGDASDPRVGRSLYLQLLLMKSGGSYGTATATYTNLQLESISLRPSLAIRSGNPTTVELSWPTNLPSFLPERATNMTAGNWETMTNLPTMSSNRYILPVEVNPGAEYFRLRKP